MLSIGCRAPDAFEYACHRGNFGDVLLQQLHDHLASVGEGALRIEHPQLQDEQASCCAMGGALPGEQPRHRPNRAVQGRKEGRSSRRADHAPLLPRHIF